jgi:hypothetical protein
LPPIPRQDVPRALARAEALRARGAWLAGYVAYEAGYALEPKLARQMPRKRPGPLVALGVYDGPLPADAALARAGAEGRATRMTAPEPLVGRRAYGNAARKVFDYIAAGDCYQVNLTFPMAARLVSGSALGLYGAFRRTGAVGHGAFVDLGVGPVVVSRSPELFFKVEGGKIDPPDEGHAAPRQGCGRGCGNHRRPEERREGPGREPDDRGPSAQRHLAAVEGGDGEGAGFVRDRKLCDGAPDDLDRGRGAGGTGDACPG